mmetsp:Transcript_15484/g.19403  ORF Transcript_15484/g.19403 Transcript_15484/m.19403 type:complete len:351 (+) Transcript_15484:295-1347(+)
MDFSYKSVVLPTTERFECESDHKSIPCRRDSIFIKYHIDREPLNRGAYGVVRQCVKKETQDLFAVKTIPKLKDLGNIKDIQAEISTLKFLSHSNVMKLEEVYENENAFHLITPLYRGGTLFDRIFQARKSRKGCLSEEEAAILTKQMLCAIAYCHSQGVVHRDVKPENFMFEYQSSDARLVLIDFGYARTFDLNKSPAYLQTILGTPHYIAPEVVAGRYTEKCDIWSVGVILYLMLCGRLPFSIRDDDEDELLERICNEEITFLNNKWVNVSKEAKTFVKTFLCKRQCKRPSAEDALKHNWLEETTHDFNMVDNLEESFFEHPMKQPHLINSPKMFDLSIFLGPLQYCMG